MFYPLGIASAEAKSENTIIEMFSMNDISVSRVYFFVTTAMGYLFVILFSNSGLNFSVAS